MGAPPPPPPSAYTIHHLIKITSSQGQASSFHTFAAFLPFWHRLKKNLIVAGAYYESKWFIIFALLNKYCWQLCWEHVIAAKWRRRQQIWLLQDSVLYLCPSVFPCVCGTKPWSLGSGYLLQTFQPLKLPNLEVWQMNRKKTLKFRSQTMRFT